VSPQDRGGQVAPTLPIRPNQPTSDLKIHFGSHLKRDQSPHTACSEGGLASLAYGRRARLCPRKTLGTSTKSRFLRILSTFRDKGPHNGSKHGHWIAFEGPVVDMWALLVQPLSGIWRGCTLQPTPNQHLAPTYTIHPKTSTAHFVPSTLHPKQGSGVVLDAVYGRSFRVYGVDCEAQVLG